MGVFRDPFPVPKEIPNFRMTPAEIHEANTQLNELLHVISLDSYFRYFFLDFYTDCLLWQTESVCSLSPNSPCRLEVETCNQWSRFPDPEGYVGGTDVWGPKIPGDIEAIECVDLIKNPEKDTGFSGPDARKIWTGLFEDNLSPNAKAFSSPSEDFSVGDTLQDRLLGSYFRSFGHAISVVKAKEHGDLKKFASVLGSRKDRMQEVFSLYGFLLSAMNRLQMHRRFPLPGQEETQFLLDQTFQRLDSKIPYLWENSRLNLSKSEISDVIHKLRNISALFDCITCHTCRVHAQVAIMGIGTSMHILSAQDEEEVKNLVDNLSRCEYVALLHSTLKFSEVIAIIDEMRDLYKSSWKMRFNEWKLHSAYTYSAYSNYVWVVALVLSVFLVVRERRKKNSTKEQHPKNESTSSDHESSTRTKEE